MSMIFDSPIGWAQWRLRNGWKTPLIAAGAYAGILIFVMIVCLQSDPRRRVDTMIGWRTVLIIIQACILALLGGARISASIRLDITQHLVESHRLMPVSPLAAVSGYLWGPNAAPAALWVVGLLGGAFATASANLSVPNWMIANLVLLSYSLFCWVAIAFAASQSRAAGLLVFIGLAILSFSTGPFMMLAPGAVLLNGPMMGRSVYDYHFDPTTVGGLLVVSSIFQLLLGSVLYVGVARKYRWPDEPALGITPALLALVIWLGGSMYAVTEQNVLSGIFRNRDYVSSMLTAVIINSMLIAVIPIANSVRNSKTEKISPLIAIACAAAIATTFCMLPAAPRDFFTIVGQASVLLISWCVGLCLFLRLIRGWRATVALTIVWVLLLWIGPLAVDFVRYTASDTTRVYHPTLITGCSPVGALAGLLNESDFDSRPGVVLQLLLCVVLAVLYFSTRGRSHAPAAAT